MDPVIRTRAVAEPTGRAASLPHDSAVSQGRPEFPELVSLMNPAALSSGVTVFRCAFVEHRLGKSRSWQFRDGEHLINYI